MKFLFILLASCLLFSISQIRSKSYFGLNLPHQLAYENASIKYDIEIEALIAIGYIESRHNLKAVSNAGAIGVMQLMPRTAKWICGEINLFNPIKNIDWKIYGKSDKFFIIGS